VRGNPRTHGRRFILLLFGKKNQPVCIVKAGIGKKAMQLIQRGQDAMISLPGSAAGIPKLFGTFHGENLSAFAMEFLDGESPSVANAGMVISLLNSWVQEKHNVILGETALWGEMAAVGSLSPLRSRLEALQTRPVRPVIWHGDFTPWNMKLDRRTQRCTVFDWERGHLPGVPGWDWFHFVIQSSALVKNLSAAAMRDELEQLFRSEIFSAYAARCGIAGCERELVLAYLLYDLEVRKPVEGAKEIRALLELLTESWTTDSKS